MLFGYLLSDVALWQIYVERVSASDLMRNRQNIICFISDCARDSGMLPTMEEIWNATGTTPYDFDFDAAKTYGEEISFEWDAARIDELFELWDAEPGLCGEPPAPGKLEIGSDAEVASEVVKELTAERGELVHADGAFWYYADTAWTELDGGLIQRSILVQDGRPYGEKGRIRLSKTKIESITHIMTIMQAQPDFFRKGVAGINCASGFIRFVEGVPVLEPHDPQQRSRHTLSASWSGSTEMDQASLFATFLERSFREDMEAVAKIALLQELAGSAITGLGTKLAQPKAIILHGRKANNGKSTYLEMISGILPPSAVSAIKAGDFSEPRYRVKLAGKLLNTSDELSSADSIASDLFKAIITGDPIAAHDVYRAAIEFRPMAQHVFATNRLPGFIGGLDKGVRRRLLVLEFERPIPEREQIANIGERVLAEERDVLLAWAVEGAARLLRQGRFTQTKSSEAALEKWTRDTDPVRGWIALRVEPGDYNDGFEHDGYTRPVLYQLSKDWAEVNGYRKDRLPGLPEFMDRLAEDFPDVLKRRKDSRRIHGITVLLADRKPDDVSDGFMGDETFPEGRSLYDQLTDFESVGDHLVGVISEMVH
jgi:P4 family phage/plasmid primase-like protien